MSNNLKKYDKNDPVQELMLDCLFSRGLTAYQTSKELEKHGFFKSPSSIINFKSSVVQRILDSDRVEFLSDYVLDSVDRVKIEFNDLLQKTKELLNRFEEEDKPFKQLDVIREIRSQLELALKAQSRFNSVLESNVVNVQNNFFSNSDVIDFVEKSKMNWFKESNAELVGDKIVFNSPSGELIDLFRKWKFSQEFSKSSVINNGE